MVAAMGGRTARVLVATAIGGAAVLACGGPRFPSDPTAVDRICTAACNRRATCVAGEPPPDQCRESCAAHRGRWAQLGGEERKYWRQDYVAAIVHCTDTIGCAFIDDRTRYFAQCYNDTQPDPTERATEFCERLSTKVGECGGTRDPQCVRRFGAMSDPALDALISCIDSDCKVATRCWSDALSH
jgi:hypothetical protein